MPFQTKGISAFELYHQCCYKRQDSIEFDAMRITATDFDRNAKTIFGVGNPEYMMYSPFTGLLTPIKRIIEQLAALHQNGITAGDFDALQITAGDFDALQISAYDFDWNGATITP